jgi:hypothetical protein
VAEKLDPPAYFNESEVAEWRAIVDRLGADFFPRECRTLLATDAIPGSVGYAIVGPLDQAMVPAPCERAVEACRVFVGSAASFQDCRVDQLNVDAAVLHGFDRVHDFHDIAGYRFWICIGPRFNEFHCARPERRVEARFALY